MSNQTDKPTLEVGVKAFVYNNKGEVLVLKRSKPYPGQKIHKWDIPGGRINTREPILKALAREIKEETGLRLTAVDKILAAQDILRIANKHIVRITFLGRCTNGKIKLDPNEHVAYRWVSKNEISKLRYDKYLSPVIKILINDLSSSID